MELRLLGPVQAWAGQREVDLGTRRQRLVLALLALEVNKLVPVDRLIELSWPTDPPASARRILHTHISRLRTTLAPTGQPTSTAVAIHRRGGGYLLRADPVAVDVHLFRATVARSRATVNPDARVQLLRSALALWRGPALADTAPSETRERVCTGLEEARLAALEDRIDTELSLGRHHALIDELVALIAEHQDRPRLIRQLVLALYRGGRTADALSMCRAARRRLSEAFGLDPTPELATLELDILRGVPPHDIPPAVLDAAAAVEPTAGDVVDLAGPGSAPGPRLLPADATGFTGRIAELAKLVGTSLAGPGGPAGAPDAAAVPITVICGMAGVGKTALAVHWGHQVAHRFPDGQLYVDLRGYAADPAVPPVEAIGFLLRALGVAHTDVPADLAEAAALYRSRLSGRRMLIVLDNAASAAQVRPLLPGSSTCSVLVTSRDDVLGLVARDGARRLAVRGLSPAEARQLLATVTNPELVLSPSEADEVARLCGYLPLALRIAGANLITRAGDVAGYLSELRHGHRLRGLSVDQDEESAVSAAFDLSYRKLPPDCQRLFLMLGLCPGPDVGVDTVAAVAGVPVDQVGPTLAKLVAAHLLEQPASSRYRLHDLVSLYARHRAVSEPPAGWAQAARQRLFSWYIDGAQAAARVLYPQMMPDPPGYRTGPDPGPPFSPVSAAPAVFDGPAQALAWLDAERCNLVAAAQDAAPPWPAATWQLGNALRGYLHQSRHNADATAVAQASLSAAQATGVPGAVVTARLALALAFQCSGDLSGAIRENHTAQREAHRMAWPEAEAAALVNLGAIGWRGGDIRAAARYFRRALTTLPAGAWPAAEITAAANLGMAYRMLGRPGRAVATFTTSLTRCQEMGLVSGEAQALDDLGTGWHDLGRLTDAEDAFHQALARYREVGDVYGEALALTGLSGVRRDLGAHDDASRLAQAARELAERIGDRKIEAEGLVSLGATHLATGDLGAAAGWYDRAIDVADRAANRYAYIEALVGRALVDSAAGDHDRAFSGANTALDAATAAGYRLLVGAALGALARIRLDQGRLADAVDHAQRALTVHRATGCRLGQARALLVAGQAWQLRGRPHLAKSRWQAALAIFTESGAGFDADQARRSMRCYRSTSTL
jgi:DNA-binding SARP family transcriptional activator/tetratricopeptide (TPR) repeat protein